MNKSKKITYIEIARAMACIFVIITHELSSYFNNQYEFFSPTNKILLNTVYSISKIAVPVFIIITGGLLLKKEYSTNSMIKKSMGIAKIILSWSIIYIIFDTTLGLRSYSIIDMVNGILNSEIKYHLWYLYMLLWLYLAIPFIKSIIPFIEKNLKYFIILSFIIQSKSIILQTIKLMFGIDIRISSDILIINGTFICLVLGYLIVNKIEPSIKNLKISLVSFILSSAFTILMTHISFRINGRVDEFFLNNYSNVIIMSASFLVLVKCAFYNMDSTFSRMLIFIGKLSLGIYLVHPMILDIVQMVINKEFVIIQSHTMLKVMVSITSTTLISILCSYAIDKIKILRKVFLV